MSRKINETLSELLTGIFVSGLIIQIIQILVCSVHVQFKSSGTDFTIGLWIGIATALGLAVHMYHSINKALDMIASDAENYMRKAYMIRTAIILAVAGIAVFLNKGYVMAVFLGVLCLKFGAFLQPLIHKIRKKFRK